MSSTDEKRQQAEIEKIFFEKMLPLAEKIKGEKKGFFETRGDPGAGSYYVQRAQRTVTKESFGPVGCETEGQLASELANLWASQGYPELAPLAPAFSKLAEALRSTEEESEEVSPFIYVMF